MELNNGHFTGFTSKISGILKVFKIFKVNFSEFKVFQVFKVFKARNTPYICAQKATKMKEMARSAKILGFLHFKLMEICL